MLIVLYIVWSRTQRSRVLRRSVGIVLFLCFFYPHNWRAYVGIGKPKCSKECWKTLEAMLVDSTENIRKLSIMIRDMSKY